MKTVALWEMLVPYVPNTTLPWQSKVTEMVGGCTIMSTVSGCWGRPDGSVLHEPMNLVRVACTREEMIAVAAMTRDHFNQFSVSYYRVSDEFRRTAWDEAKDDSKAPCDDCSSHDFRCWKHCVIHVLHHGRPFCAFSDRPPSEWPEGHKWVGPDEAVDANCPACLAEKAERDRG